jgi:alkylated DNA repair dioxygenase AlkB
MKNELPTGFSYRPEFLSPPEEQELLQRAQQLDFGEVKIRGVTARRRVAHFGWLYHYESRLIEPGPPVPEFLLPLRSRIAELAQVKPENLCEVLVTEYPAGAGIGWHRDAPAFGLVVAVSLLGSCRLRLRREKAALRRMASLTLAPRSAYMLNGVARWVWQHSIAPTRMPRYSITFRTLRSR